MGTVESKPLSRDIALFDRLVPDEGIVAFSEKDVYAVDLTVEPASKAIWYESRHFSLFFANRGHLVRKDNPTPKVLFKQALKGCNSFRFTKDGFKGVTDATEEYYSHVGVVPMQASAAAHFDVLVSRFAHQDRQPGAYTSEYLSTCFVFVVAELCGTKMVLAAYPARRKVTTVRIVRLSP